MGIRQRAFEQDEHFVAEPICYSAFRARYEQKITAHEIQKNQPAIHWARLSKSQFVDPVSNFTLVVSRLLPAALDRYPRGLTGHVAVPNRSILR